MIDLLGTVVNNVGATAIFVAIIAFFGAIGGAIVSSLSSARDIYVNSITSERSKWIEKLRTNITKYIAIVEEISVEANDNPNPDIGKQMLELSELSAMLRLQLNPDGAVDQSITSLMASAYLLCPAGRSKNLHKTQSLLIAHSQWLLKDEWEVVKMEAYGIFDRFRARKLKTKRAQEYTTYVTGHGAIDAVARASEKSRKILESGEWPNNVA